MRVGWVGPRPAWLELDEARAELEGVELEQIDVASACHRPPDIAHVTRGALEELERRPGGAAAEPARPRPDGRRRHGAHAAAARGRLSLRTPSSPDHAGSSASSSPPRWPARTSGRRPSGRSTSTGTPRKPRLAEAKGRGRDLRRFRRFHRLAGPVVLFAGPYTEAGGLDLLLEAVFRLRERMPDLRLAAIPHGPTDPRYRDRCEMRALGLGHHGIVEWDPADSEIPFWYAIAAVVCSPAREAASAEPAKRAAAAARPFVGSDLEPFREHVDDGTTGHLVPVGDLESLQAALESVLGAEEEATRLGDAALRKAEADYSPAAAAQGLRRRMGEPGRYADRLNLERQQLGLSDIHSPSRSSSAALGSAPSCSSVTAPA